MKSAIVFLFLVILQLYCFAQSTYLVETSNIKLPIDNTGNLAYVDMGLGFGYEGGTYDSITFLFSAGFLLSGKNGDSLWSNGQAGSLNMVNYLPGNVDSNFNDPKYRLYFLTSNDEPFGDSWLQWKQAVELGADYYDGDHNGQYIPIDLNGNGQWDINEDRPNLLGDFTSWCVYNDGVPYENRRNIKDHPQGIEIRQTIFTFRDSQFPESPINNTIFVRYRIINSGKFTDNMDSVYFSSWADPDIGFNYTHDLAGCDTILNSGFAYKDTSDHYFGSNPPSYFLTLLQGPHAFIAGETFFDSNSNGLYDQGVDISLDTACSNQGSILGIQNIFGAKNLAMTSFMHTMKATTFLDDPKNIIHIRNYLLGLKPDGSQINPCIWLPGTFYGCVECLEVNPHFCYSGDPIVPVGWINIIPHEQRFFVNTGPFTLKKNQAVDIIVSHTAARGMDAKNSFIITRENTVGIQKFYNSNFVNLPTGIDNDSQIALDISGNYHLAQNYPNPFNPSTKIKYSVPIVGIQRALSVLIKVYDVLGNEVATIVDEYKPAGNYEIEFQSSVGSRQLASGIYYYQLKVGEFVQTKKMILLR